MFYVFFHILRGRDIGWNFIVLLPNGILRVLHHFVQLSVRLLCSISSTSCFILGVRLQNSYGFPSCGVHYFSLEVLLVLGPLFSCLLGAALALADAWKLRL